ncbi:Spy/CpxP family protein refolding chaperone [Spirosoma fluviale]|uniref:LTXXQ motif family protein n=1 Tax=Spirosoma fluviale TaxID=1597977 RepID=A0A286GI90_9BACT|nr:Spy/CpxP family protein refolding chaperone [Spirosoma fluviale]SOD95241.1 LTXXQ motif family protein [Spirosoma fluviale]
MRHNLLIIFVQFVLICTVVGRGIAQSPSTALALSDTSHHLSKDQLAAMKRIQTESEKKAAPVALRLAQTVKQIYANMLADQEDKTLRQQLAIQMNKATIELLSIKGQSMRDIVGVLTPEQKQLVKQEMQKPNAKADLAELIGKMFNVAKP